MPKTAVRRHKRRNRRKNVAVKGLAMAISSLKSRLCEVEAEVDLLSLMGKIDSIAARVAALEEPDTPGTQAA